MRDARGLARVCVEIARATRCPLECRFSHEAEYSSAEGEDARLREADYPKAEYSRREARTLVSWRQIVRMPSTFGGRRERSSPGGGSSGCRVLSAEGENARLLAAECQDAEYSRRKARTLVFWRRNVRMPSTLGGRRERSSSQMRSGRMPSTLGCKRERSFAVC